MRLSRLFITFLLYILTAFQGFAQSQATTEDEKQAKNEYIESLDFIEENFPKIIEQADKAAVSYLGGSQFKHDGEKWVVDKAHSVLKYSWQRLDKGGLSPVILTLVRARNIDNDYHSFFAVASEFSFTSDEDKNLEGLLSPNTGDMWLDWRDKEKKTIFLDEKATVASVQDLFKTFGYAKTTVIQTEKEEEFWIYDHSSSKKFLRSGSISFQLPMIKYVKISGKKVTIIDYGFMQAGNFG